MKTIDLDTLANVTGGSAGYAFGYGAGTLVTKGLLAVGKPETACHQTGAPILESWGYPNAAAGARQSVIDTCARAGVPVK